MIAGRAVGECGGVTDGPAVRRSEVPEDARDLGTMCCVPMLWYIG